MECSRVHENGVGRLGGPFAQNETMKRNLLASLRGAIANGRLADDSSQMRAANILQAFQNGTLKTRTNQTAKAVYLHGSVGTGKSMLLDMFYELTEEPKRRAHFHEFMLDVHERLHALQQSRPRRVVLTPQGLPIFKFDTDIPNGEMLALHRKSDISTYEQLQRVDNKGQRKGEQCRGPDPVQSVATALSSSLSILCLDELQVTDVADAMILRQLFQEIFRRGVRVVFTSNRAPDMLYERGLNRQYFSPFVHLLHVECVTLRLGKDDGVDVDYRKRGSAYKMSKRGNTLATLRPRASGILFKGRDASLALWNAWKSMHCRKEESPEEMMRPTKEISSKSDAPLPLSIPVSFGRVLQVKRYAGSAAWFNFEELCGELPGEARLGASDYIALARNFDELFLANIPILTPRRRNEARRFVMLVDAIYEERNISLHLAVTEPLQNLLAPLIDAEDEEIFSGAEVVVDDAVQMARANGPTFQSAPVGGKYQQDGELASFYTAKDEKFMLRRTLSRLTEMCVAHKLDI